MEKIISRQIYIKQLADFFFMTDADKNLLKSKSFEFNKSFYNYVYNNYNENAPFGAEEEFSIYYQYFTNADYRYFQDEESRDFYENAIYN